MESWTQTLASGQMDSLHTSCESEPMVLLAWTSAEYNREGGHYWRDGEWPLLEGGREGDDHCCRKDSHYWREEGVAIIGGRRGG